MASSSSKGKRIKMTTQKPKAMDQAKRLNFSRWFLKDSHIEHFTKNFVNRKLIAPRYCDIFDFEMYGFQFPSLFKVQGLEDFITDNTDYFPDLVKMFYCNLEIKKRVGKNIIINASLFTSITSLKSEGARILVGEKYPFEGYNKMEIYHSLYRYSFEQYKQKKRKITEKDKRERKTLAAGLLFSEDEFVHFFINWVGS